MVGFRVMISRISVGIFRFSFEFHCRRDSRTPLSETQFHLAAFELFMDSLSNRLCRSPNAFIITLHRGRSSAASMLHQC
jgi:hypothetical protein